MSRNIFTTETKPVNNKEVSTRKLSGVVVAREQDGDDIFDAINTALAEAGENGEVWVEPGSYPEVKPITTQLKSQALDQTILCNSASFNLADGADVDMVSIEHDNFDIYRGTFNGNRSNNNINSCITTANATSTLEGINLNDVAVAGAPNGIELVDVSDSSITDSGSTLVNQDVDKGFKLLDCVDSTVVNAELRGFKTEGIEMANCQGVLVAALAVAPDKESNQDNGMHLLGCTDCRISGVIEAGGLVDKGVLDEAYDVGGANESFSTANYIDLVINGVTDIGVHIRDAEKELVDCVVNGEYDGGRTNQAWLVDAPNGLANAQHRLDINAITVDRITDTNLTGPNNGMRIAGHASKVNNTSTIGAGGTSVLDFTFGQATPDPVVETVGETVVRFLENSNRTTTNPSGQVSLDWSGKYAFGAKPTLSVTIEQAGQWHVASWDTDGNGRYIGATIQVTDSSGTAVGNGVDVTAKTVGV